MSYWASSAQSAYFFDEYMDYQWNFAVLKTLDIMLSVSLQFHPYKTSTLCVCIDIQMSYCAVPLFTAMLSSVVVWNHCWADSASLKVSCLTWTWSQAALMLSCWMLAAPPCRWIRLTEASPSAKMGPWIWEWMERGKRFRWVRNEALTKHKNHQGPTDTGFFGTDVNTAAVNCSTSSAHQYSVIIGIKLLNMVFR